MEQRKLYDAAKDHTDLFNVIAGVRVLFLIIGLFNSTIELGLSFSIIEIGSTATDIVFKLLTVTICNILLLILYIQTVKKPSNQSSFLIYIVEVLTMAYGLLGIYAFVRYILYLEIVTFSIGIGFIGLIDLLLINTVIGSYFVQNRVKEWIIEIAIVINAIIILFLLFN